MPVVNVVSEKGKLIGIVSNWDIIKATASSLAMDAPLTNIMTADVITALPETSIIDCLRLLENYAISSVPIVENDKVFGVVSGERLAGKTLYNLLQATT